MLKGLIIQERDLALLEDLFISRVMTVEHAAKLHFSGSSDAAFKRLQKLKRAGLIKERKRHVTQPSALFLAKKAFQLLSEKGLLIAYPRLSESAFEKRSQVSEATIKHELAVMDTKAAIISALKAPFRVEEFTTWPRLNEFRVTNTRNGNPLLVKPDGLIRIRDDEFEQMFYLELDRSTETVDTLAFRATCYLKYFQSGALAVKFGKDRSAYKEFPFRVLMVFKSVERRNNVALRLIQSRIFTQVWLATLGEVRVNPLGKIWLRPLDLDKQLTGTPFAGATLQAHERYSERDRFIENHVPRHGLLDNG